MPSAQKVAAARSSALAHGGREARSLRIADAPGFAEKPGFPGVAAIAEVTTGRGKAKPETRLFLFSRPMNGFQIGQEVSRLNSDIRTADTTGHSETAHAWGSALDPGIALIPKPYTRAQLYEKFAEILHVKGV